ncbi:MAG: hypothetical protein AAGB35_02205 [Pseudomonadota bacterium]
MQENYPQDLSKCLWLYLPILVALFPYVMRIISVESDQYVFGELGVIENFTFIILAIAIILGVKILLSLQLFPFSFFRFWIGLLVVGCIYYAGEEISWGQHWFGWATPESWQNVNDQGETNLHNTSALLDQVPRMLLTIAAVVGGIIVPLLYKIRNVQLTSDNFFAWLWPTYVNIPTCLLAILVSLHEKIYKLFDTTVPYVLDIRAGETKECLLAIFLFMYIASFYKRLKQVV